MKIIAIYPGRFQPFGKHHYEAYKWLSEKFGSENTYIVTSDKVELPKSPLSFSDKKEVISQFGIPSNRLVKVKNPYKAEELTINYDPDNTAVVFMYGEKDANRIPYTKKDGSPGYFQPFPNNPQEIKPLSDHGYIIVAPHFSLDVDGEEMSGTALRKFLSGCTPEQFEKVMGWYDERVYEKLKASFKVKESVTFREIFEKLAEGSKIEESKNVGEVYHFTSLDNLRMILLKDKLLSTYFSSPEFFNRNSNGKNNKWKVISTTRNKNFPVTHKRVIGSRPESILVLDGTKMSSVYKSTPFSAIADYSQDWDDENQRYKFQIGKSDKRRRDFGDESEEMWYGPKINKDGGIIPISKYIHNIVLDFNYIKKITKKFDFRTLTNFIENFISSSEKLDKTSSQMRKVSKFRSGSIPQLDLGSDDLNEKYLEKYLPDFYSALVADYFEYSFPDIHFDIRGIDRSFLNLKKSNVKPENVVSESKSVGEVYHFTDLRGLQQILDQNLLKAIKNNSTVPFFNNNNNRNFDAFSFGKNSVPLTLSTTRDKNFPVKKRGERADRVIGGTDVSIVLDGTKMSSRYKSSPYEAAIYSPQKGIPGPVSKYDPRRDPGLAKDYGDEMEEMWFGKKINRDGGIKGIKDYIKYVVLDFNHIFLETSSSTLSFMESDTLYEFSSKHLPWVIPHEIMKSRRHEDYNLDAFKYAIAEYFEKNYPDVRFDIRGVDKNVVNRLEKIATESIIKESKSVGEVYHFTNLWSAYKILHRDFLRASENETVIPFLSRNTNKKPPISAHTISTTRDKNFPVKAKGKAANRVVGGVDVSFALDGNKMSSNYKSVPYNASTNHSWAETGLEKDILSFNKYSVELDKQTRQTYGDEMEEMWLGQKINRDGGIKNISKYIKYVVIDFNFITKAGPNLRIYIRRNLREDEKGFLDFIKSLPGKTYEDFESAEKHNKNDEDLYSYIVANHFEKSFPNVHFDIRGVNYNPNGKSDVSESTNSSWIKPTDQELKDEYHREYTIKGISKIGWFPKEEDFLKAARSGKIIDVTPELDSKIDYRSNTRSREELTSLLKTYRSWPEFRNEKNLSNLYDRINSGQPMTMPIILKIGNRYRVFSGNTRLDIAFQLGKTPKALLVTVPGKITEVTSTGNMSQEVDDGPRYFFGDLKSYKSRSNRNAIKAGGYSILDWILDDSMELEKHDTDYPNGPVPGVSFFPAGIPGKDNSGTDYIPDSQGSVAYHKWKSYIERVVKNSGLSLIDFLDADRSEEIKYKLQESLDKILSEQDQEITRSQLNELERFLDGIFKKWDIDINFQLKNHASNTHFYQRLNDPRNVDPITLSELKQIFIDLSRKYGQKLSERHKDLQYVLKSFGTKINVPFVLNWNNRLKEFELVPKTIMRKKNFKTPSPVLAVENKLLNSLDEIGDGSSKTFPYKRSYWKILSSREMRKSEEGDEVGQVEYTFLVPRPVGPEYQITLGIIFTAVEDYGKSINMDVFFEFGDPESDGLTSFGSTDNYSQMFSVMNTIKKIMVDEILRIRKLNIVSLTFDSSGLKHGKYSRKGSIQRNSLYFAFIRKAFPDSVAKKYKGGFIVYLNEDISPKTPLLSEGGAAGHMMHPFDDLEMTFGEMKDIIYQSLSGKLSVNSHVTEKIDGQNLMVTYKDGKVKAARNKGTVINPLDLSQIKSKFEGRGDIETAFVESMRDLESAFNNVSSEVLEKIFKNGRVFLNLEIVFPGTKNVVDYGPVPYLILHGTTEFDENANKVDVNPHAGKQLYNLINKVNSTNQNTFTISKPQLLSLKKVNSYGQKKDQLMSDLWALQSEYSLGNGDTLGDYYDQYWKNYIEEKYPKLAEDTKRSLIDRWARSIKSNKLTKNSLGEYLSGVVEDDKQNVVRINSEIRSKFEEIFLKLGVSVLENISDILSFNSKESIKSIRKDLLDSISKIKTSNNSSDISKAYSNLQKLKSLGGLKAIVPSEGLVFTYNGKLYKLTGSFAPINQILGLFKF